MLPFQKKKSISGKLEERGRRTDNVDVLLAGNLSGALGKPTLLFVQVGNHENIVKFKQSAF